MVSWKKNVIVDAEVGHYIMTTHVPAMGSHGHCASVETWNICPGPVGQHRVNLLQDCEKPVVMRVCNGSWLAHAMST